MNSSSQSYQPNHPPRKVKIVCTLGPSSQTVEQLEKLMLTGMDIARLNFSHGSHEFHANLIRNIREASRRTGKHVAIMQDLQGPKLRAGKLKPGGLELKEGDKLVLFPEGSECRTAKEGQTELPISAEIAMAVSQDVKVGARILFDDGKLETRVTYVKAPEIHVDVVVGGKLTDNKGMNLPGTPLTLSCLTDKDIEDLKFGLEQKVDAVALSFVRDAADIEDLRQKIKKFSNHDPLIVAKIEREEAIECMDRIIEVTDGLLVARGDMAVEIGAERVPTVQKKLIYACNEMGVPVITATQMLESMIGSPTPTRAEASDVANAVFDGTDAVMLSGETASGKYPLEAVETMSRVITESERSPELFARTQQIIPQPGSVVESVEFSASKIASHLNASLLACITHSGVAARALAKYRPQTKIVAITERPEILRRLAFTWGVRGVAIDKLVATDDIFSMVERVLLEHKLAEKEETVVITAGIPTLRRGTTNMIKVHKLGANPSRDIRA